MAQPKRKSKFVVISNPRQPRQRRRGARRHRLCLRPLTEAQIKKRIREATASYFLVCVFYSGHDRMFDRKIERAAKKRIDGSGFDFECSLRDIEFGPLTSEVRALAMAERIKKIKGVRVMIRGFWKA